MINWCKECKVCQVNGFEAINTKNRIIKTSEVVGLWMVDLFGRMEFEKTKVCDSMNRSHLLIDSHRGH